MPVDAETQAVLDLLASLGSPELADTTPEQARELSMIAPPQTPTAVPEVRDANAAGRAGDIPVRIYSQASGSTAPALVYFHGGGWVLGDLESHDEVCRVLCSRSGVTVISVDYRLAPEARFPAAAEDCFDAVRWVVENAAALNIDPARVAVGGDSAGGNLAAAVALMARDEGGPDIRCQLLVYPVTSANFDTVSYLENAEGYLLTRRSMQWFWDHYVPGEADRKNGYAAPLAAEQLSGLPPALVQTAEYDPLRDEGEAYAARLQSEGNDTQLTRYDGTIHGFFSMQDLGKAKTAMQEAVDFISKHLV